MMPGQITVIHPTRMTIDNIEGRYVGEIVKVRIKDTAKRFQAFRVTGLEPPKTILVVPLTQPRKERRKMRAMERK